jgi:hypothetical protein
MDPTTEQLKAFYRVIRNFVVMSSYISFVELGQDENLYIHAGRYDAPSTRSIVYITPDGEIYSYD